MLINTITKRLFIPSLDKNGYSLNTQQLLGTKAKHADKYNYVLHYLITARAFDKRLTPESYIPVHSRILDKYVTSHHAPNILKFWVEKGVLEREPVAPGKTGYIVGQKSISYRFTADYRDSKVIDVSYLDERFEKKVWRITKEFRLGKLDTTIKSNAFINFNLRELRINSIAAQQIVNQKIAEGKYSVEKANIATVRIQAIRDGDWFCCRDVTGHRIHHNYATLNKILRSTCYLDTGEALVNVDITNSQPIVMAILLKQYYGSKLPGDVQLYIQLCETGKFYNKLAAELGINIESDEARSNFKKLLFKTILYGHNKAAEKYKEWQVFEKKFPNVAIFITEFKRYDYTALSIALQRLESEIIIEGVIGKISRQYNPADFFAITIHDSITTTSDKAEYVKELIIQEFLARGIKVAIELQ